MLVSVAQHSDLVFLYLSNWSPQNVCLQSETPWRQDSCLFFRSDYRHISDTFLLSPQHVTWICPLLSVSLPTSLGWATTPQVKEASPWNTASSLALWGSLYTQQAEGHTVSQPSGRKLSKMWTCSCMPAIALCYAMLSHFSRVRLCATRETAAHQAPPSLGFSRQEHWSGLPFPSPMHESEKWKWSRAVVSDS